MIVSKLLGALARIVFIFAKKIDPARDVAVVIDNICSVFLHLAPLSMLPSRRTFSSLKAKPPDHQ
ncbi:hypothetical protein ACNJYD_19890 [Bradyrhizobium sp. DASA03005]|uniref:hypothetical protein n=1 Tax=Bradyrhizobium sp. SPXBL-02 TaxID=3395912 RepID=UPI003F724E61